MSATRLFHISEDPNIQVFEPRPSPSHFDNLNGNVVFAITEQLLHNYLLPRDCPRVTFYPKHHTTAQDKEKLLGHTSANFVVAVEEKWYEIIQKTTLYCYEFQPDNFVVLDEGAGYYVSYHREIPLSVQPITDILAELSQLKVELRVMPNLWPLAQAVLESSMAFSLIRMRNALPKNDG